MTETPDVQGVLVDVLAGFAASSSGNSGSSGSGVSDVLSLSEPSAHCLRICAHILRQALGSSRASGSRTLASSSFVWRIILINWML